MKVAVHRPLVAIACVAAVLGTARHACADDSIEELFRRGVELRRSHQDAEALEIFERIVARAPTPAARAQMALAEQALGRWLLAERDLDGALASSDDGWIAKNLEPLRAARSVIEAHLAWIAVSVDVEGAAIVVANVPVSSGVEVRVVAGGVVVEARAEGRLPAHRVFAVAPGEHATATIALVPVAPPPPPVAPHFEHAVVAPVPTPPVGAPSTPVGPIVVGALGVAALAAGTYFGVRTIGFKSERDGACTNGCAPAAATYDSDARSSATASTVAFGVGAGLVATGIVWWILDRDHARRSPRSLDIAPVVGGGERGLVVRFRL